MMKNVIFDIGGVLADFRWREYMSKDLGFPPEVVEIFKDRIIVNHLWDELDLGLRSTDDIIADMKGAVPEYPDAAERFFEHVVDIAAAFPYASTWISSLKEAGYKVYLLSNYPKEYFELHAREKFDFVKLTDGRVVSGFERMSKPDKRIYELLLSRYALKPDECVFIDDRKDNIAAAEALGIHGIVFHSYEQAQEELSALLKPQAG